MLVAFHSPPKGFFKLGPPYGTNELLSLVRKASHLGFRYFQIGPTSNFSNIDGKQLKNILDKYGMECNVHVGGLYDARRFVLSEQERKNAQRDLHVAIDLAREVSSSLVSFHPPFFKSAKSDTPLARVTSRFLEMLKEEVDYAISSGIRLALESFCYPPFVFNGLDDFTHFVSNFHATKLGILLEVGHLYQAAFNLDEAIERFGCRIFDVHVHDAKLDEDYKKATHLPIGRGNIDFLGVINSLRRVKYDGWLTLEIHGDECEISESKRFLDNLING